ncbi:hypothetical protein [Actinoplanes rectilineatus]|uniref:hypothetical protein n=1 Tax=Actinoplanes rectilineatus TaxID=113571 RepID=UPI0012FA8DD3|nr:hypothetical protein [Actinoplanes rectilineatus]
MSSSPWSVFVAAAVEHTELLLAEAPRDLEAEDQLWVAMVCARNDALAQLEKENAS